MTQSQLSVAVVQLNSQHCEQDNLQHVQQLVGEAASRGARLILLPENAIYMGHERKPAEIAVDLVAGNAVFDGLRKAARNANAWVIVGGIAQRAGDPMRAYNTCAVFDPSGSLRYTYRKMHLYDVALMDGTTMYESHGYVAGDRPVCAEIDGFRVGLSICYDLRFPELYRHLTAMGAELIVVPAAFTMSTGKDHWHVLLRARAIENQAYVLAAGQWGRHGKKRHTYGHSMIVDPWGTVVAQCSDGVGICYHCVDREYLQQVRTALPALRHRRIF